MSSKRKGETAEWRALSLFANIGVAEAYLSEIGVNVVVANEFVPRRAELYRAIYPDVEMICGDITDELCFRNILRKSRGKRINVIMATPPCQGMSAAGKREIRDERNSLILPVIKAICELKPKYVFIENVPQFFDTKIVYDGNDILIPDLIQNELGGKYHIEKRVINTEDFSVPQSRKRAIMLLSRKKSRLPIWKLPRRSIKKVTLEAVIGKLPSVDPMIEDADEKKLLKIFPKFYERKAAAEAISNWHRPPVHPLRQIIAMLHTPTGESAFNNTVYYPKKKDGTMVKGYETTYRRQRWDAPALSVTMDNRKISSQGNVHPGRFIGRNAKGVVIYSDPRVLTTYELMLVYSLPANWPIPENTAEPFLRRVIGEGVPPLFVKKVFKSLGKGGRYA